MSNHHFPEDRRAAPPEDNEPSWRPQDPEQYDEIVRSARDDRDPDAGEPRDARRWESDEDPGAGRTGEQRLRELQRGPWRDDRPSPGSFEDRDREHVHRGSGPHRGKGPAGYCADERIRDRVCESLTDDDEIDASDIAVSVSGGEVTLSGTVDDRRTKRSAEDCAYSVTGVRDVQNRLRVRDDRAPRSNPSSDTAVYSDETSAQDSKHRA